MGPRKSSPNQIAPDWLEKASLSFVQAELILAVAVIPLFMVTHYTTEPFEFNKAALLRTLAPLLLVAWVISLLKTRRLAALGLSMPLALAVAGYAVWILLAGLVSIAPAISLWGSHVRPLGTLTTLAALTFFLAASSCLRSGTALAWTVSAILLASLPVSLYTLLQLFGADPLSQSVDVVTATSFLGNPNFIAAYLTMVIPLTCSALLSELWRGKGKPAADMARLVFLSGLLLLQAAALWFSRGFGALLGLLTGMILFLLLLTILTQRRQLALTLAVAIGVAGLVLVLLGFPFSSSFQHKLSSGTAYQRLLIWHSVEGLILASPARLLIGYGPETLYMTLNPYYPSEEIAVRALGGGTLWDRAHNSLLDTAASAGLLGVATSLWVTGAFLLEGLSGLGIRRKGSESWITLGAGGLVGALGLPFLLGSWSTAPLGLAVGLVLGLFFFLVWKGTRSAPSPIPQPAVGPDQFLLVGLLAALVAHFTEVQFGFELVPTHLAFWVYGGIISAIVRGMDQPVKDEANKRHKRTSSEIGERRIFASGSWLSRPLGFQALLVGAILATIAFSFGPQELDLVQTWPGLIILLGSVWIFASMMGTLWEPGSPGEIKPISKRFPLVLLGSLVWGSAFLPGHLWVLRTEPVPAHLVVPFALYLLVTTSLMAGLIFVNPFADPSSSSRLAAWLAPFLLALAIGSVYRIGVVPVLAESYARAGFTSMQQKQVDTSIALLQRAAALQPERDRYVSLLADAYLQKAKASFPPEAWLRHSESLFLKAAQMTPTDPDHFYNLGTLHLMWAALVQPWGAWREHLETSINYYLKAVKLGSPHHRARVRETLTHVFTLLGLTPEKAGKEVERRLPPPPNRWEARD